MQAAAATAMAAFPTTASSVQLNQEFDCFVVIDFEATCERGTRIYPQEIIEFPFVLVHAATSHQEVEFFRTYVRPVHHPVLTDYCKELTGIAQADVDAGVPLADALRAHDAWLESRGAMNARGGVRFAVVTWGDWDCRTMLEQECRFKGVEKPGYFDRWINLKVPFREAFGLAGGGGGVGLQAALRLAGLAFEGRPHSGLDDARNTARLLALLMRRGCRLSITTSLPPPRVAAVRAPVPASDGVVRCHCGVASRVGVVGRPGPTQGRRFMGCGNWTPARTAAVCSYFVWEDGVGLSRAANHAT